MTTDTLVECAVTVTDADGELLNAVYNWTNNGVILGSSETLQLNNTIAQPNDTLECQASVSDGYGGADSITNHHDYQYKPCG